ncbi:hypothetical protein F2Q68_00044183 [Brassica cretica]|uniref:Ubiquitin-like protease family profile domain-containing protein n=1 Tax=Brassica cretica TaxID=69181 RepID=A0A8S9LTN5_BRACR|nr:hypothetical protein F2Q68_00044183 [Brassica cretica]
MVSKAKKKVPIIRRNNGSPADLAKQSPRRKSLRYPVSDYGDEATGSTIHSTVQRQMVDLVIGQLEEAESSSKLPLKLLAWGSQQKKKSKYTWLRFFNPCHIFWNSNTGFTKYLSNESKSRYYSLSRLEGIYENKRTGDCGPCAAKFMEIHANGGRKEEMRD